MHHLTTAKPQSNLRLVTVTKKALQLTQLDLVVMLISPRPKFHFLEMHAALLLPCGHFLFLGLKQVLPVIHDLADHRVSVGRNFHQIKASILSGALGNFKGDDTNLLTVCTYQAHTRRIDLVIDP